MKILHTADFHLGAKTGNISPHSADEKRREDFYNNMHRIAEYAIRNKIDIVLISGDIFCRPDPSGRDFVEFSKFVGNLTSAGIKVVAIAGNHDMPKTPRTRNPVEGLEKARLPNFHYFHVIQSEPLILEVGGKEIGIAPIPYIDPRRVEDLNEPYDSVIEHCVKKFAEHQSMMNADYKILMAHLMLAEARFAKIPIIYASEPRVRRESLCENLFDYVALGHVHSPQKIGDRIYYAGSIERIDFSEEEEQKSFYVVTLEDDDVAVDKVNLNCRPMVTREIEYEGINKNEFFEILRGLILPEGALLKLVIRTNEATIKNVIDKHMQELQRVLLSEKKILGYVMKLEKKQRSPAVQISAEISNLRQRILEYIDRLPEPQKVRERAKEIAKMLLDEVGL